MLVDDEREFVDTLSERLSIRDMDTTVAYGGGQALEAVSAAAPDVMVLDLMMPGIDGFEVLHRIKRDHPQVQVVILTGHGSSEDRKICLAAGAFAFLQKPVDIDELSSVMRRACQQNADEESNGA
jgi:two-component system response regulator CpxR